MKTKVELAIIADAIKIMDANKIKTEKVLIKIVFGKKVDFLINDHYLHVDQAFRVLKKKFPNINWKTRHNKVPIYKITIKS